MAVELVNALSGTWDPEAYQDTYAEEVKALIARKQKGEDVVVHAEVTKGAPIVDLMDALKQSVDRSRGKAKTGSESQSSGSSRSKAKKPTVAAKPAISNRTSRPVTKAAKRPVAGKAAAGKSVGRKAAAARAGTSRRKAS